MLPDVQYIKQFFFYNNTKLSASHTAARLTL